MAKKNQIKKNPIVKSNSPDLDLMIHKYFWLVIPVFAALYYFSSKYSTGFYQDDEIGHFINMLDFWTDPSLILGNWPKPGYKLFLVIPSLFGLQAVLIANSLIASATVYLTYSLLRAYNIKYAFFGALLLGFQPLFFDLSFRSYGEIITALLIVVMILFYKKEMYFLCGLACGYIFTIRQEAALIGIALAIIFFFKKNYFAIIAIGIFPFLFNFFGYLHTGDILFVISEMSSLGEMDFGGANRGFFHYFKAYIFIIGPVCLTLFLLGYFGFLPDTKKLKEYILKFDLIYIVFTITFLVQVMLMVKGTNPGTWRYLLHISPLAAFFATVGLNNLASVDFKKTNYIVTGILLFFTITVLSKTSSGLDLQDVSEYWKFAVVGLTFLLTIFLFSNDTRSYLNKLSVSLIILSAVYLFFSFEPRQLTPENISVKEISEYLSSTEQKDKNVFITIQTTNMVRMFGDDPSNKERYTHLNTENLTKAKPGDLIIWDSHYGYRPEYKNDVKIDDIMNDKSYKMINQFTSTDSRFKAAVFEKIN